MRLTFDPHLIVLSALQGGIKYHFLSLMTQPGIEPRSPGPLVNTLLIRPMRTESTLWDEIATEETINKN